MSDLQSFEVQKEVCERAATICKFLESAASLMERQFGSACATFSINFKAFQSFLSKYEVAIKSLGPVLQLIETNMFSMLKKYRPVLCGELVELVQILDSHFGKGILSRSTILRYYVVLLSKDSHKLAI